MDEGRTVGECFCGTVEITATGRPELMGYCHCISCRSWSAAPVNAFTFWRPGRIGVTRGAKQLRSFKLTEQSRRQYCGVCGGHVMTAHPMLDLVDVYAAVLPSFPFRPQLHLYYAEKVLAIRDGLPKLKDYPIAMGGTGETVPE
jgi:hypothetical protein